jgi:coproporphyrinogen III oxidase-like Fe-S oxidoreductase
MIAEIAGFVTRHEGRKFQRLVDIDESIINANTLTKGTGLSLYVHIPFCRSLCSFCCFNRYLFREDLARRYFIDLKRELETYQERGFVFRDVYFGGGTPTVLMDELGDIIRNNAEGVNVAEY